MKDDILESLRLSKKYRNVCADTLERVVDWALAHGEGRKLTLKRAKGKLHQIHGAFFDNKKLRKAFSGINRLSPASDLVEIREACREVLACHESTRERLPFLDEIYERVFCELGQVRDILDLACGLNPFAWPWINAPEGCRYAGMDIDHGLVDAANCFFSRLNLPHRVTCQDLFGFVPDRAYDVVLALKTLPTLERQEKGASERLIRSLDQSNIVVSFPCSSLTGKAKGMKESYTRFFDGVLASVGRSGSRITIGNELFYFVKPVDSQEERPGGGDDETGEPRCNDRSRK